MSMIPKKSDAMQYNKMQILMLPHNFFMCAINFFAFSVDFPAAHSPIRAVENCWCKEMSPCFYLL